MKKMKGGFVAILAFLAVALVVGFLALSFGAREEGEVAHRAIHPTTIPALQAPSIPSRGKAGASDPASLPFSKRLSVPRVEREDSGE